MSQPAARVGDMHMCPMATPGTPPIPHVGGPILPPGAPTVLVGGQPAARVGDMAVCVGPPDSIVKGAFPVLMGGQPAARMTDSTAHGGMVTLGCPTVLIGLAGTSGNPWAGAAACAAAAAGRNPPPGATDPNGNQLQPNTAGQSYNNCGVESSRQIINQATPANVSQEALLNQAMNNGWAHNDPNGLFFSGGTHPASRAALLNANGVPASTVTGSMQNLELAVAQGRGTIAAVDAGVLWGPPTPMNSGHAVLVTGVEYDDAGNVTNVIINDTGTGQCSQAVPAATFQGALQARGRDHTVTNNPIW
jgi:uncharacterized Zn-binding protein involved in type VI secretion